MRRRRNRKGHWKDPQFVKAAELAVQAAELLARIEAEEQEVTGQESKEVELPEDVLRLKELLGKTTLRRFDKLSDRSDQKRETGSVADPVEAPALRQAQGLRTSTTGEPCRTTCSAANKMKSKAELRAEYSKIQEELNKALGRNASAGGFHSARATELFLGQKAACGEASS